MGDDIFDIINDRSLVLINHQSTSDVPLTMVALDRQIGAVRKILWIMSEQFKYTNFGLVSIFHRDFFISSVRATCDGLLS